MHRSGLVDVDLCGGERHPGPYPDHVWDPHPRWKVRVVPNEKRVSPSWIDVRAVLQTFDRAGLLGLVQDLYAASKDNQAFLHARLGLGHDQLKPYKASISSWICPDLTNEKPAHIDFKSQEGDCGLQESGWAPRRADRAVDILLRGSALLPRILRHGR